MNIQLEVPWEKRIKNAIRNKAFTPDDVRLAQLWITDPVSELWGIIEFTDGQLHKGPQDIHIVLDGMFFTKAVEEDDVRLALNCMKAIAKRVRELHNLETWKL